MYICPPDGTTSDCGGGLGATFQGAAKPVHCYIVTRLESGRGLRATEWLVEQKSDAIVAPDVAHKGPRYVFSDAGIQVHTARAERADEALRAAGYLPNQ